MYQNLHKEMIDKKSLQIQSTKLQVIPQHISVMANSLTQYALIHLNLAKI